MSTPASFRTRSAYITHRHATLLTAAAAMEDADCMESMLERIIDQYIQSQPLLASIAELMAQNRKAERDQIKEIVGKVEQKQGEQV